MSEKLTAELMTLLGEDAFVALTQNFGGRRLYVPKSIAPDHDLWRALGEPAARRLIARYMPAVLRIPLARDIRARYYRAHGRSHGQIASMLGLTETAIDKLFARMDNPPIKGSAAQLSLFSQD